MSLPTLATIIALLALVVMLRRHPRWMAPISTATALVVVLLDVVHLMER